MTSRVPAFKVTQDHRNRDTDRSATYDFLIPINVPYSIVWVSRIVSEINGNFSRKSQIFPMHPSVI